MASLIMLALVFQGCPISNYKPLEGEANIVTQADTVLVSYRDINNHYQVKTLYPSPYVQSILWCEVDYKEKLSEEERQANKLHVKKLTNHSTSYVLHGYGCYVDDIQYGYGNAWGDPDISYMKKPCELDEVINGVMKSYPDWITLIEDNEVHTFDAEFYDIISLPHIVLPKD